MEIDLHGMDITKALNTLEMALLDFEENSLIYELIVITGKGTGKIKNAVNDFLYREGYNTTYVNEGCILIKKD